MPDQDQRGTRDAGGFDHIADRRQRAAQDALVGPAHAVRHDDGAIGAVMRHEIAHDARQVVDREMDRQRRTRSPERGQLLALRHRRGAHRRPRQDDGLAHLGQCQLGAQRRRRRGEGRHARRHVVGDAERVEAPHLLGDRAVDRGIAGMDARHVLPLFMRALDLGDDLVEMERRRIDDPRTGRRRGDDLGRHQRAGIEADRAALDEAQAAQVMRSAAPGPAPMKWTVMTTAPSRSRARRSRASRIRAACRSSCW